MQTEYNTFSETDIGSTVFVHTWRINNFKALHPGIGRSINSVGKLNDKEMLNIKIYADGFNNAVRDYVAIAVQFMKFEVHVKRSSYLCVVSLLDKNKKEYQLVYQPINQEILDGNDEDSDKEFDDFVNDRHSADDNIVKVKENDDVIDFIIKKLVVKSYLFDEKNNLLPNGNLVLRFKLYFPAEIVENPISIQSSSCICNTKVNGFEHMFNNEKFSDIKIVVGSEVFWVCKCILAHRSPVFLAMFEHDMEESKTNIIEIPDLDHVVIEEMLRFMYVGKVNNIENIAHDLLIAAEKYDINDLKSMCEKTLIDNLNVETVISLWLLAEHYGAKLLKEYALDFFKLHAKEVIQTPKFKEVINNLQPLLSETFQIIYYS